MHKNWELSILSGLLLLTGSVVMSGTSFAQATTASTGIIAGSVTADQGPVRAVRVKATDASRKIAYTVFTKGGHYRIYNLPASTYQVTAIKDGFESTIQNVDLKAGETKTADEVLTAKEAPHKYELVDMDTLFPPGPGRDILFRECAGCHSMEHIPWQKMAARDEDGWRIAVNRMFQPIPPKEIPIVSPEAVSVEQRETIIKYFAANFGLDSKPRDLKLDELPLDEDTLSDALWIQYDMPPPGKSASGRDLKKRGTHDIYPSIVSPTVWMVDTDTGSILGMDLLNLNYPDRFREWKLSGRTPMSVHPHGIIEANGLVYWTELDNSSIGELNPKTGEVHQYRTPVAAAPHTLRADSKGNIWFSSVYDASRIGELDAKTKTITEWDPSPKYKNAHYYGMTVDKQDRVWAVGMTASMIVGYDPRTSEWSTYVTPTPSSGPRRISVTPDGMVWFSENMADRIAMLNPSTGKITEYKSPYRHGGDYECYADAQGNLWVTLRAYEAMAKFNPKTKSYTYYPYPTPKTGLGIPKLETDAHGDIWGALGVTLINLKPHGNVPTLQSAK
jgi:streptogramin lyase